MIELKLLGSVDLRLKDGARAISVLRQPRRFALLAYIACEGAKRGLRRDTILALFWPEASQQRASRALSQALHFLRKQMGEDVFVVLPDETIGINPNRLRCDVTRIRTSISEGKHREGLAEFGGEFLRGFHLADLNDFNDWLVAERTQLRRVVSNAAVTAAKEAKNVGDTIEASNLVWRAFEIDPWNEPLLQEQLAILNEIGDRAGAARMYERFRQQLEEEHQLEPSPNTVLSANAAFIETPLLSNDLSGERPRIRTRRLIIIPIASVVLTIVLSGLWGLRKRPDDASSVAIGIQRIVLPQSRFEQLKGLETAVLARLGSITGLQAVTRGVPAPSSAYLLRAALSAGEKNDTLTVVVLTAQDGRVIGQRTISLPSSASEQSVAAAIVEFVSGSAGEMVHDASERKSKNYTTLKFARAALARADSLRDLQSLSAAREAYASVRSTLEPLAKSDAHAAFDLAEESIHEMWLALLTPNGRPVDALRRGSAALAHHNRTLETDELDGVITYWLGQFSVNHSIKEQLQLKSKAKSLLESVVSKDPSRARAWAFLSAIHYSAGEFGLARIAAEQAYRLDRYSQMTDELLGRLYTSSIETNDLSSADYYCGEFRRRHGVSWISTYCRLDIFASRPRIVESPSTVEALLDSTYAHAPSSPLRGPSEYIVAIIAARTGDVESSNKHAAKAAELDDAELEPIRAWWLAALNKPDSARVVLSNYVRQSPVIRSGVLKSVRYSILQPKATRY